MPSRRVSCVGITSAMPISAATRATWPLGVGSITSSKRAPVASSARIVRSSSLMIVESMNVQP